MECEAAACSVLNVSNSDTSSEQLYTHDTQLVSCDAGFVTLSGYHFNVSCEPSLGGEGVYGTSLLDNVLSCEPDVCSEVDIVNSEQGTYYGLEGNITVLCEIGHVPESFEITCNNSGWNAIQTCEPSPCDSISLNSSNVTNVTGFTKDVLRVNCNDGYASNEGKQFSVSCVGTAPRVSSWDTAGLECTQNLPCIPLTVSDSNISAVPAEVGDSVLVVCDSGYTVSDGTASLTTAPAVLSSFVTECVRSGADSIWNDLQSCVDVDECLSNPCSTECVNLIGESCYS